MDTRPLGEGRAKAATSSASAELEGAGEVNGAAVSKALLRRRPSLFRRRADTERESKEKPAANGEPWGAADNAPTARPALSTSGPNNSGKNAGASVSVPSNKTKKKKKVRSKSFLMRKRKPEEDCKVNPKSDGEQDIGKGSDPLSPRSQHLHDLSGGHFTDEDTEGEDTDDEIDEVESRNNVVGAARSSPSSIAGSALTTAPPLANGVVPKLPAFSPGTTTPSPSTSTETLQAAAGWSDRESTEVHAPPAKPPTTARAPVSEATTATPTETARAEDPIATSSSDQDQDQGPYIKARKPAKNPQGGTTERAERKMKRTLQHGKVEGAGTAAEDAMTRGHGVRRRSSDAMLSSLREVEIKKLKEENFRLTETNQRLLCAVFFLGLTVLCLLRR